MNSDKYIDHHDSLQDDNGYNAYNHLDDGCPTFIPKNKIHNVLKYHSDYRSYHPDDANKPDHSTCLPAPAKSLGVVSDGESTGSIYIDNFNTIKYANSAPTQTNIAENQFLNLNNSREIYDDDDFNIWPYDTTGFFKDQCDKTIQNLPINDELRAKDGNGYFVFNLYKKSQSVTVEHPVNGSSVQNVDSMEFAFFGGVKVEKCQKGWIWLEISDFELTGWTTDNTIYAYYWENTKEDTLSTEAQLTSGTQPITDPNFRMLNNSNRCVQAMRMSDIVGGAGKKLIIGCNRFTSPGEELYINLMIGLKPNDVFRGHQYKNKSTEFFDMNINDVGSPVFKYKKAEFKFGGLQANTWNNKPYFYSSEGFISQQSGVNAPYSITANFQYLDNNGAGVINRSPQTGDTTSNTKMGIPNGGTRQTLYDADLNAGTPHSLSSSSNTPEGFSSIGLKFADSVDLQYEIMQIFKAPLSGFDDQETNFIFKMPRCWGGYGGQVSSWTSYGLLDESYYPSAFSSASFTVKLYAGADVTETGSIINWEDLRDTFVELESWDIDDFTRNFNTPYAYSAPPSPTVEDPFGDDTDDPHVGLNNGFPRNHPNHLSADLDDYRYVSIDLKALVDGGFNEGYLCLYLAIESGTHGLKPGTLVHNTQEFDMDATASNYYVFAPSSYTPPQYYPESQEPTVNPTSAILYFKSEYGGHYKSIADAIDQGNPAGNCGSLLFKPPRIIDSNLVPDPENYYM